MTNIPGLVYNNAIRASRRGNTQYVMEYGQNTIATENKNRALWFLSQGWELEAVCNNGVMERSWLLNSTAKEATENYSAYLRVAQLLGLPEDKCMIYIRTQEFYTDACDFDAISMCLNVYNLNDPEPHNEPQLIWGTPKDKPASGFADPSMHQIYTILDILLIYGVKQDKEPVIRDLQQKLAAKEVP